MGCLMALAECDGQFYVSAGLGHGADPRSNLALDSSVRAFSEEVTLKSEEPE